MTTVAERLILTLHRASSGEDSEQTTTSQDSLNVTDVRDTNTSIADNTRKMGGNKIEKLRALLKDTELAKAKRNEESSGNDRKNADGATMSRADGSGSRADGSGGKADDNGTKADDTTTSKADGTGVKADDTMTSKADGTGVKADDTSTKADDTTTSKADDTGTKADGTGVKADGTGVKADDTTTSKADGTGVKADDTGTKADNTKTSKADATGSRADGVRKERCVLEKLQRLLESNSKKDNAVMVPNVDPKPDSRLRERRDGEDVLQAESPPRVTRPESVSKAAKNDPEGGRRERQHDDKTKTERRTSGISIAFSENVKVIPDPQESPECEEIREELPKIPKRRLQSEGRFSVVVVSCSSKSIYVQEVSTLPDLVTTMKVLETEVAKEPTLREGAEGLRPKSYVAALRPRDKVWYRVQLKAVGENEAEVFFVDYGKRERVGLEGVKPLPEAFYGVPAFATAVHLHGIEDLDRTVAVCLEGQVFEAEVVEASTKGQTITLYMGEDGQCVNEMLKELSDVSQSDRK